MKKTKPSQFWKGTMVITSRKTIKKALKRNLWPKHYNVNFVNISFWKRLSLSEAVISRWNKKILYLVFCRLEKHFRFILLVLREMSYRNYLCIYKSACYENNAVFGFMKLSFQKIIPSWYILNILLLNVVLSVVFNLAY